MKLRMGEWEDVKTDDEWGDEVDGDMPDDEVDERHDERLYCDRDDAEVEGVINIVERRFSEEEGASNGDPFFRFVPLGFCLFDLKPSFICLGNVLVTPTTAFLKSSGFAWR